MNEVVEIASVINNNGKNATAITHALKKLGGGSMKNGLRRISQISYKKGVANGFGKGEIRGLKEGGLIGTGVTIIAVGLFYVGKTIWDKTKQCEENKKEEIEIADKLEEGFSEYTELENESRNT